jgi:hypothetical protein
MAKVQSLQVRVSNAIETAFAVDAAALSHDAAALALLSPVSTALDLRELRKVVNVAYVERYRAKVGARRFNDALAKDAFDQFWSRAMKRAEFQGWVKPKAEQSEEAKRKAAARAKAKEKAPAKVDGRTARAAAKKEEKARATVAAPDPIVGAAESDVFASALAWVRESEERKTAFVAWVDAQRNATRIVKAA